MLESRIAYAICMVLATWIAASLIRRRQRSLPLDTTQRIGILVGGLVGATLAAKLPFVLAGTFAGGNLLELWFSDGKTVLWGLAGGYLGVEFAKWTFYVRVSTGDSFVVPVAIAIALGRIGCFLYGCCYGIATNQSWGVYFTAADDGGVLMRHPTQLYEFVFHTAFACAAAVGIARGKWTGQWMPLYLVGYAVFRLISEVWRPEPRFVGGLTFYQWSSLGIGIGFTSLLLCRLHVEKMRLRLIQHSDSQTGI
ncbi:Prolipoprotein diacylglyceryl transferase [Novipirellula galeiformis]|uniref:Prolipoprotein diacylglyceryl transferase n=1 Tax=Novipirellula galeiformis TaxID=2528004 RepID=A0A5C6CC73_9BACT|nr:prolipoprotein diacylglyceryl transferase family protein [Novipirellula galeiformis]TWU22190.1 Prolipoprotein diacylglyceryl transferase [Novipirellula galeiformis]